MTEVTKVVSKQRQDNVHGGFQEGLVHAWAGSLTWCGKRMRGVAWHRPGSAEDVTCGPCKAALSQGRQKRYRRS